jgi:hypothetical protein
VSSTDPCGLYTCDPAGQLCLTGCAGHTGCVQGSVCSRRQAHSAGQGSCLSPGSLGAVPKGTEISQYLQGTSKTHVAIPPGTYTTPLVISGRTVHLIGLGAPQSPVKLDPAGDGPAITVLDGASVTLQGLQIQGATGANGHGVQCVSTGATSEVTIIESRVQNNTGQGVTSYQCDVTLRRSRIQDNAGGGVKLADGDFVIINNLVTGNGKSGPIGAGSGLGGLQISAGGGHTLTFVNNTVADNAAQSGTSAGILCAAAYTLSNSIVWDNGGGAQAVLCSFQHSDVMGGAQGLSNIQHNPQFGPAYKPQAPQCQDSGDNAAPGVSALDLEGGLRIKGGKVDMGAFEIK